jgi:hypothetical protein
MQTEALSVRISKAESRALRERARQEGISKGADACLVRMAELQPDASVWTLDRHFHFYRKHRRQTLSLVTPW